MENMDVFSSHMDFETKNEIWATFSYIFAFQDLIYPQFFCKIEVQFQFFSKENYECIFFPHEFSAAKKNNVIRSLGPGRIVANPRSASSNPLV